MDIATRIYFDRLNNLYYGIDLISDLTGKPIRDFAILFEGYSRSKRVSASIVLFSGDEMPISKFKLNKALYEFYTFKKIHVIKREMLPRNLIIYIPQVPQLKNSRGDADVFDVADAQVGDETITDNTDHGNRRIDNNIKLRYEELTSSYNEENKRFENSSFSEVLQDDALKISIDEFLLNIKLDSENTIEFKKTCQIESK